jgi:hypothetical protein
VATTALYLISFDLSDPFTNDYEPLWDFLGGSSALQILHSAWVVKGEVGQVSDLYGKIQPLLATIDRLLIHEIFRETAYNNLGVSDKEFQGLLDQSARDLNR